MISIVAEILNPALLDRRNLVEDLSPNIVNDQRIDLITRKRLILEAENNKTVIKLNLSRQSYGQLTSSRQSPKNNNKILKMQ